MSESNKPYCPECEDFEGRKPAVDRRGFLRSVGGTAAVVAFGAAGTNPLRADTTPAKGASRPEKPAEALIKELCSTLTPEQRKEAMLPWNHGAENGKALPTRMRMFNRPIGKPIGEVYTPPQQELIERALRAISSDEEGYRRITRNGTFDSSKSLTGCGANIFGDPTSGQYAWVFTGHHLTVRCDGNSVEGAAFGGPMYYGHSPNGYSDKNVFFYQTKSALSVFDALSEAQRKKAVITGSPGEHEGSVKFRAKNQPFPGVPYADLMKDQQGLVEKVMRDVLSPYRKEDADEVMNIIKTNGGMEKLHLAFYQDSEMNDNHRWHFWRIEGPGFVWNFRVLPHVHTYVNISSKV